MNFEIVEGTYNFFKIQARGFLSPCKVMFKKRSAKGDIKVYYSRTNVRPDEEACDRVLEDPQVLFVRSIDGKRFYRENIYIKIESVIGVEASIKAVFPAQDRLEQIEAKSKQEQGEVFNLVTKSKLKNAINNQVQMYLNEPRAYDDYMAHIDELTAKRDEDKQVMLNYKRSPSQRVDYVGKNKTQARNLQIL